MVTAVRPSRLVDTYVISKCIQFHFKILYISHFKYCTIKITKCIYMFKPLRDLALFIKILHTLSFMVGLTDAFWQAEWLRKIIQRSTKGSWGGAGHRASSPLPLLQLPMTHSHTDTNVLRPHRLKRDQRDPCFHVNCAYVRSHAVPVTPRDTSVTDITNRIPTDHSLDLRFSSVRHPSLRAFVVVSILSTTLLFCQVKSRQRSGV